MTGRRRDSRWWQLASELCAVHGIAEGTRVDITLTGVEAMDAVVAFVDEIHRRGGVPQVRLADELFDRSALVYASLEALAAPAPLEVAGMDWCDVHIAVRAMVPPAEQHFDPRRLATQRIGKGVVSSARWRANSWVLIRVPTPGWAELIGVELSVLLDEFFAASMGPWDTHREHHTELCALLEGASHVRIVDDGTDLLLGVAGRRWLGFAGEANIPDGEVATAPLEDEVDGGILFPGRFWFAGAAFDDLALTFEAGQVVDVRAARGAELARELIATDSGSDRVGELGIGTSSAVRTATGDLLIDEKILGTVHLALGRAYPACGGSNDSSLHWDIVADLRRSGSLLVDGNPYIDRGRPVGPLAAFT